MPCVCFGNLLFMLYLYHLLILYFPGNWSGHPNDGSWTGQPIPPDQQRDGNWAAFDGSPPEKTPQKPARKEITWRESPDNSSSGEEIESNDDDDDEEQQGLIR